MPKSHTKQKNTQNKARAFLHVCVFVCTQILTRLSCQRARLSCQKLSCQRPSLVKDPLLSKTLSCQRPSLNLSETLSELVRNPLLTCQRPSLVRDLDVLHTHTHAHTHTHTHTRTHTHTHTHTHFVGLFWPKSPVFGGLFCQEEPY